MRRSSNSRMLVWPFLGAVAVMLILVTAASIQDPDQWPQGGRVPQRAAWDESAPARPHHRPPTLQAMGQGSGSLPTEWATAQERRRVRISADPVSPLATEHYLGHSGTLNLGARLLAPVRSDAGELAGYTGPDTSTTSHAFAAQPVSWPSHRPWSDPSFSDAAMGALSAGRSLDGGGNEVGGAGDLREGTIAAEPVWPELRGSTSSLAVPTIAAMAQKPENREAKPVGVCWPRTPALEQSLAQLSQWPSTHRWVAQVRDTLAELQAIPSLSDPLAGAAIAALEELGNEGVDAGEGAYDDREFQSAVLRTSYALLRRVAVWKSVWQLGSEPMTRTVSARLAAREAEIGTLVEAVRQHAQVTGDVDGWSRYLLLDEVQYFAEYPDREQRRLLAQRLLSRVTWEGLDDAQQQWLGDQSLRLLMARVRPWADTPIDYASLLAQLERQESEALDLGGIAVATAVQNLRFSENPRAVAVAEAVNDYYRNANIRVAISAALVERLLPEVPERTTLIRHEIAGVPVQGSGRVASRLGLELIPARGAWQFRLRTLGDVRARTEARRWPVAIANRSHSRFDTATPIVIDRRGVRTGRTVADVRSQVRLGEVRTEFDGLPVIEQLVREVALYQYEETSGQARQQSERLVRNEVQRTVDAEVDQQIDVASDKLMNHLLGPLAQLRLDPLVVDLSTTESRLSVRYRVAGDWQLAACTPRPRAMSDSLMSMQIHQSALNNTFEQLLPAEQPQSIRQVAASIREMFGADPSAVSDEIPEDVRIQFAPTRPITVEIEDGRLWLTLRVIRLTDDRDLNLSHFVVRVAYRPRVDGMRADLVRDSVLHISGPRLGMRERLPIRAIFNKVLSESRPLPLVSEQWAAHPAAEGLAVGQLDLVDGWLALSINPASSVAPESVAGSW